MPFDSITAAISNASSGCGTRLTRSSTSATRIPSSGDFGRSRSCTLFSANSLPARLLLASTSRGLDRDGAPVAVEQVSDGRTGRRPSRRSGPSNPLSVRERGGCVRRRGRTLDRARKIAFRRSSNSAPLRSTATCAWSDVLVSGRAGVRPIRVSSVRRLYRASGLGRSARPTSAFFGRPCATLRPLTPSGAATIERRRIAARG
jgi:hypothetical protein